MLLLHVRFAQQLSSKLSNGGQLILLRSAASTAVAEKEKSQLFPQYIPPEDKGWPVMDPNFKEHPERDVVNFPHYVQPLWISKVRMGFLPDSWFNFFYHKTGVTGPYLFTWGLFLFVYQKEIWVNDHTFRQFLYYVGVTVFAMYALGPRVAKYCDKMEDEKIYERRRMRTDALEQYSTAIQSEQAEQRWLQAAPVLLEAKRENVALQLEQELRRRLQQVSDEVRRRLNFMVEMEETKKRLQQKHMVSWIVDQVRRGVSAQLENDALNQCILDLKTIARKQTTH